MRAPLTLKHPLMGSTDVTVLSAVNALTAAGAGLNTAGEEEESADAELSEEMVEFDVSGEDPLETALIADGASLVSRDADAGVDIGLD